MDLSDTICAPATPPGRGAIAVVRLSGTGTHEVLKKVFNNWPAVEPRRATLGLICDPSSGTGIDEAVVTCFPAPNSYTGEDVAEISLHGSPVLVGALLDSLCAQGARLAEPGEFTLRAFVNGKMDLSQAEAVRDVIEAVSFRQAQMAGRQRSGELSRQLRPLKERLVEVIVHLETAVEFVEEDLALDSRTRLAEKLEGVQAGLGRWIDSFRQGRILREGFGLAIIGRPNVGKSSLFNALLRQPRAIVTEIPGTTRDLVSELTSLEGMPVRLVDTAGVRATEDRVEQLGVDRSMGMAADADAVLLIVDRSLSPEPEEYALRDRLEGGTYLVVMNKSDLPQAWSAAEMAALAGGHPLVEVSALTGEGIGRLEKQIVDHLLGSIVPERDGVLVTNLRHCRCLEAARRAVERGAAALRGGLSEEFVLVDLHEALRCAGEISGETSREDLLSEIFSRFCIGK